MREKWIFERLHEEAIVPSCAHPGEDAGQDLAICEGRVLQPYASDIHVRTGIAIQPPPGWWMHLVGRSSNAKLDVYVHPAIIDGGYRGELFITVTNTSSRVIYLNEFQRLAQLVPHRVENIEWQETKLGLIGSARGNNGFGSTGK